MNAAIRRLGGIRPFGSFADRNGLNAAIRRLGGIHSAQTRTQGVLADVSDNSYALLMDSMTEEEADALDEELTHSTPRVDFTKPDVFIRQRELLNVLNPVAADYILTRARPPSIPS